MFIPDSRVATLEQSFKLSLVNLGNLINVRLFWKLCMSLLCKNSTFQEDKNEYYK